MKKYFVRPAEELARVADARSASSVCSESGVVHPTPTGGEKKASRRGSIDNASSQEPSKRFRTSLETGTADAHVPAAADAFVQEDDVLGAKEKAVTEKALVTSNTVEDLDGEQAPGVPEAPMPAGASEKPRPRRS